MGDLYSSSMRSAGTCGVHGIASCAESTLVRVPVRIGKCAPVTPLVRICNGRSININAAMMHRSPRTVVSLKHQSPNLVKATTRDEQPNGSDSRDDKPDDGINIVGSIGIFILWAGLLYYATTLSPNQTPNQDMYFLKKLVGLENDGFQINKVFTQLFFIMGIWPFIYTGLLIPSTRSKSGVTALPFVGLSFGIGAFGLLPFMALWKPSKDYAPLETDSLQYSIGKAMESRVLSIGLLLGTLYCVITAATAGSAAWAEYVDLFWQSRFVHVTSIDFLTLTFLAPFWMDFDATRREWRYKDSLLLPLTLLPLMGPVAYLALRPQTLSAEKTNA